MGQLQCADCIAGNNEEEMKTHRDNSDLSNVDDFSKFKSYIIENKDHCSSINGLWNKFTENVKECEHIKNPKSKKHHSFWSNVLGTFEKIGKTIADGFKYGVKEIGSLIDEFEKDVGTTFDAVNAKLSDYFQSAFDKILVSIIEAVDDALAATEDFEVSFLHLYATLRAIPILHNVLPVLVKNWQDQMQPAEKFYNWSFTIKTNPSKVRNIRKIDDIHELIADSQKDPNDRKRVRVSTFRHSFSPLFADNDDEKKNIKYVQGLLLPHDMTTINIETPELKYNNDFTEVVVAALPETTGVEILDDNKIRVKCGTSNNTYTQIAAKRIESGLNFPSEKSNVLQYFQGYCGTHAVACHGGGINTTTICDYITKLTMINYEGKEVVYEGDTLKKMGAHFGLLGIVTEMELQYDPSYLALFAPKRRSLEEYFPAKGPCTEFQNDVAHSYYNEFFWFPFSDSVFINTWKREFYKPGDKYVRHPPEIGIKEQELELTSLQTFANLLPGLFQQTDPFWGKFWVKLVSLMGNKGLKTHKEPIRCPSFDALHFRHGLNNMRILDMEWVFPLPKLLDEEGNPVLVDFDNGHKTVKVTVPDVSLCRDLWLGSVDLNKQYAEKNIFPQLLPMEMRIIRGSDVCMSAAHGADFAVYIEVLTIVGDERANNRFYKYCQDLTDRWAEIGGTKYMRPHWGKYWQGLKVGGIPIIEHLKETYKEDIEAFNVIRKEADPHNVFVNDTLAEIFGE